MKATWLLTCALTVVNATSWACAVCRDQQPKLLKGITHGTGPENNWDYLIIIAAITVVLGTLVFSCRFLLNPGETNSDHIKQSILNSYAHE